MWSERVRAWRESGETAEEFARSRGFAASTLHGWSSRLSRTEAPRFLRLVPKTPAMTSSAAELVVPIRQGSCRLLGPDCRPEEATTSLTYRDSTGPMPRAPLGRLSVDEVLEPFRGQARAAQHEAHDRGFSPSGKRRGARSRGLRRRPAAHERAESVREARLSAK
ncbi:IS66 family insertion sequence element accessory protein TnpA [Sorangium sp. So ce327]|uniref:IS66 family insertion sequence element accessory protein TnpA n=1 Tax=Sorangium sp. So ce327 TaxID=3133301 RepID=UPI003F5F46DB